MIIACSARPQAVRSHMQPATAAMHLRRLCRPLGSRAVVHLPRWLISITIKLELEPFSFLFAFLSFFHFFYLLLLQPQHYVVLCSLANIVWNV